MNPVESPFAAARLRTDAAKRFRHRGAAGSGGGTSAPRHAAASGQTKADASVVSPRLAGPSPIGVDANNRKTGHF
jgi:hypothetical protein